MFRCISSSMKCGSCILWTVWLKKQNFDRVQIVLCNASSWGAQLSEHDHLEQADDPARVVKSSAWSYDVVCSKDQQ